jgi:hypothetical protein
MQWAVTKVTAININCKQLLNDDLYILHIKKCNLHSLVYGTDNKYTATVILNSGKQSRYS